MSIVYRFIPLLAGLTSKSKKQKKSKHSIVKIQKSGEFDDITLVKVRDRDKPWVTNFFHGLDSVGTNTGLKADPFVDSLNHTVQGNLLATISFDHNAEEVLFNVDIHPVNKILKLEQDIHYFVGDKTEKKL